MLLFDSTFLRAYGARKHAEASGKRRRFMKYCSGSSCAACVNTLRPAALGFSGGEVQNLAGPAAMMGKF